MKKIIIIFLFSILLLGISKYVYDVHFNFNFEEVSKNKVYKSGVIPPEKIAKYIEEHQLKSVIDLRFPHTKDKINNPEIPEQLIAEKLAVEKLDGVNYFNLGTDQVPTQDTVDEFLEIMDDLSNYPAEAPMTKLSAFNPNVEALLNYKPDLIILKYQALIPVLNF